MYINIKMIPNNLSSYNGMAFMFYKNNDQKLRIQYYLIYNYQCRLNNQLIYTFCRENYKYLYNYLQNRIIAQNKIDIIHSNSNDLFSNFYNYQMNLLHMYNIKGGIANKNIYNYNILQDMDLYMLIKIYSILDYIISRLDFLLHYKLNNKYYKLSKYYLIYNTQHCIKYCIIDFAILEDYYNSCSRLNYKFNIIQGNFSTDYFSIYSRQGINLHMYLYKLLNCHNL